MITVLYFARLREAVGRASEDVTVPPAVGSVGALRAHLIARGSPWSEALGAAGTVRVAVNQAMAHEDTAVQDGDEVAFFPPVTGG